MDKWRRKSLREREISELTTCNMRYMTMDVEKTTLTRKKCFIPRSTGILYLLCSASTISIHSGNFSASPVSQHLLLLFFSKTKTGRLLTLDNCGCIKNPHRPHSATMRILLSAWIFLLFVFRKGETDLLWIISIPS